MLTTIIYRSRLCPSVPFKDVEDMVAKASKTNAKEGVTGILLFNGVHFFQLLEGPEEAVRAIYHAICQDPRHNNIVELLCDFGPARRFGKTGMELFDLRDHSRESVLQSVLDRGTTRYQMTWNDRALKFFSTFVIGTYNTHYFEIPPADSWSFITDRSGAESSFKARHSDCLATFAFQPIIDPLAGEVLSYEALIRTPEGGSPATFFQAYVGDEKYEADLRSKQTAFAMAASLPLKDRFLSVNLLPMTLVKVPEAVTFLLDKINENELIPEQVIVEFTEKEVISNFDEFAAAVKSLKSAGINVAIDHFGAGGGGLLLLARFQPDRIKINRDLIEDIDKSGPRQAIVHGIIHCCRLLEIQISAVGIEKPEEWMWLESAGIEHFQGNLFASPRLNGIPAIAWPEKKTPL